MSYFTEEHTIFRQSLRDFLSREINPHIDEWEASGEIPRTVFRRFGEMGYFGILQEERYGGLDLDFFFTVIVLEELARVNSGGFGAAVGAHAYLALTHLAAQGNEEQKEQYLVPGIRGDKVGCLALTEPDRGSDLRSLTTSAVRKGDHYVVNGSKTFITNGVLSDFIVAAVQMEKGISMLLIDRDMEGVSATPLRKLGWHASDTGEISFNEVRVPVENLLGTEGHGFYYIMQHFVLERLMMAIGGVAAADYALEVTCKYMNEREAFGRKINRFQVLRHRMAQMAAEIERDKQFCYYVSDAFNRGEYLVREAAMAKLLGTQLADRVTTQCLQHFGGYGYMEEYPLARMFRDARLGQIGGGTSEIMCEIISKMIIDGQSYSSSTQAQA